MINLPTTGRLLGRCLLEGISTDFFEHDIGICSLRIAIVQSSRYAFAIVETSMDIDSICNRITEASDIIPLHWMAAGDYVQETWLTKSNVYYERSKRSVIGSAGGGSVTHTSGGGGGGGGSGTYTITMSNGNTLTFSTPGSALQLLFEETEMLGFYDQEFADLVGLEAETIDPKVALQLTEEMERLELYDQEFEPSHDQ